ncbi:MAG TPA: phospholipid carrier-dependent glycosyltransferase [Chroococcales cyanobacterium]
MIALFAALIPIWFHFEHRLPTIDESGHILDSFAYQDLLRHPRLWKADWWLHMLTVNRFYPPLVYIAGGALKLLFGATRAVDIGMLTLFNVILSASVYGIARLTLSSANGGGWRVAAPTAGLCAVTVVNLYPELALLNRAFWLDFPLTAMVAAGLFSLLWWQSRPSWARAALSGVTLALACLTKQIACLYLVGPGLTILIWQLLSLARQRRPAPVLQVIVIAVVTAALFLPWVVVNAGESQNLAKDCAEHLGVRRSLVETLSANVLFYCGCLKSMMSPVLLAAFIASVGFLAVKMRSSFILLFSSPLIGIAAVSTLAWIFPKPQYIAPALVSFSACTGIAMARLWWAGRLPVKGNDEVHGLSKRAVAAWLVPLICLVAGVQMFSLLFAPYPLAQPSFLARISDRLGARIREPRLRIERINAHRAEDWGYAYVLDTIERREQGKPVWLNVQSNSPDLNVHTFELIAHDLHSHVRPTTSRVYSIAGDRTEFSKEKALYYQWYLLRDAALGQGFETAESQAADRDLRQFVTTGGKFELVARRALPDGSSLYLYRQKD